MRPAEIEAWGFDMVLNTLSKPRPRRIAPDFLSP